MVFEKVITNESSEIHSKLSQTRKSFAAVFFAQDETETTRLTETAVILIQSKLNLLVKMSKTFVAIVAVGGEIL